MQVVSSSLRLCPHRCSSYIQAAFNATPNRALSVSSPITQCLRQSHPLRARFYATRTPSTTRTPSKATSRARPTPPPPPRRQPPPTPPSSQTYQDPSTAFATVLANSSSPTLLYTGPTNNIFQQTCFVIGAACIAYGTYHGVDILVLPHPGLWIGIQYIVGAITVIMVSAGIYVLRTAVRLVGRVSAVPITAEGGARELLMRVEGRPLFPWRKPRVVSVPPQNLYLPLSIEEVRNPDPYGGFARTAAGRRALDMEQRARDEARNPTRKEMGAFELVMNRIRYVANGVLSSLRKAVRREGLATVWVTGENGKPRKWRMDVHDGWLLNEGTPIERLARKHRNG